MLLAPEPVSYPWYIQRPCTNQFEPMVGVRGPAPTLTNVDLGDDWTLVAVSVSNAAGEVPWLRLAQ